MHHRLLLAACVALIPLVARVKGDEAIYKGKTAAEWVEQLKSPDVAARKEALDAIPRLGANAKAAVPLLLESVNDKDPYYRNLVLMALGATGAGEDRVAVALAKIVMTELGPDVAEGMRLQTGPSFYIAASSLSHLGPNAKGALPILKDGVKRRNYLARGHIVKIIGSFGPEAAPILQETILDPSSDVIVPSMLALVRMGPKAKGVVPAMREALQKNRNPDAVARVLAAIGEDGLPALIDGLKSSNPQVSKQSAQAIGSLKAGATLAIPALTELLDDSQVGPDVGRALTAIGPDALPVLLAGAKEG